MLVPDQARRPRSNSKVFPHYQLPQGLFSISSSLRLFSSRCSRGLLLAGTAHQLRSSMAGGVRMIFLLPIPSAVLMAVLAEPITRLV